MFWQNLSSWQNMEDQVLLALVQELPILLLLVLLLLLSQHVE
jgi:hypothetical protein